MSISAALGSPVGSNILRFTVARVLPSVIAGVAAPPLAAPLLVAGGIFAAQAAWYYWSEQNRKNIIAKATKNYCASSPGSAACPSQAGLLYYGAPNSSGGTEGRGAYQVGGTPDERVYVYLTKYETYTNPVASPPFDKRIKLYRLNGTVIDDACRWETIDFRPFSSGTSWDKLSQADRDQIISALTDADWKDEIGKMLQGGTLTEGQVLNSPAMLLDNAREIPSNSRVLNPSDAAVVEAVMDRLRPLQDKVDDLAGIIAAAGLVGLGGTIAANTDTVKRLGDTLKQTAEATNSKVDAMKAEMNDKLNDLKKRSKNISLSLNIDRLLLLMTWWQTLHNCMMLSADIGRSLVSSVEVALAALPGDSLLGIPTEDPDGTPLDVGKTISTSFEGFVKGAVGAENYAELKLDLARINRIYQATTNLLNQVQSLTNDLQNIATLTGENTSRIGNALTRFGVVGEDAYKAMDEDLDSKTSFIHRLQAKLEAGQSIASNLEAIVQSVYSTEQTLIEIQNQSIEFKKAVKDIMPKDEPENKAVAKQIQLDKEASQSSVISPYDLNKP